MGVSYSLRLLAHRFLHQRLAPRMVMDFGSVDSASLSSMTEVANFVFLSMLAKKFNVLLSGVVKGRL